MKRQYKLWTIAEQKKILKEYDKEERGWKLEVLEHYGVRACHIHVWRKKFEAMKPTIRKKK